MKENTDKKILKLIKYGPLVVIAFIIFTIYALITYQNHKHLQYEIKQLSVDHIAWQKVQLKKQVNSISTLISFEKHDASEKLQTYLKENVQQAYNIAESIYQANQQQPNNQIERHITEVLRHIKFDDEQGYFFASSLTGVSKLLPVRPDLEGQSIRHLTDHTGNKIIENMLSLMHQKDEAFFQYYSPKLNESNQNKYLKVSFIKQFKPLNWFIGTGQYLHDYEDKFKKRLLKQLDLNRANETYDYFIINSENKYISNVNKATLGKHVSANDLTENVVSSEVTDRFIIPADYNVNKEGLLTGKISYALYNPDFQWTIVGSINLSEHNEYFIGRKKILEQENKSELKHILLMFGFLFLFAMLTSIAISRATARRFARYSTRVSNNLSYFKKSQEKLKHLAEHDPLTKLPNRRSLELSLKRDIPYCSHHESKLAIAFLDLDDFKKVNDLYSHNLGDKLLIELSNSLITLVGNHGKIFRFGGDEFIIYFTDVSSTEDIEKYIKKIQSISEKTFKIGDNKIHISASLGVSIYPDNAKNVAELIQQSDLALHQAKKHKKGSYQFYNNELYEKFEQELLIESELRMALERREISLVYQPQFCAQTSNIIGVEALVRWNNKLLGFVPPDEFIGIAEKCGLIDDIGRFVLEQACKDIADYKKQHNISITLSVNVSPIQLLNSDFLSYLLEAVNKSGLDNSSINIEITENVFIDDEEMTKKTISTLRTHNFGISLDDFGTGYSSLSYLKKLDISEVKIDRSFVNELIENECDQKMCLVRSIILIANSCSMKVVAEGVETREQLEKLKQLECDFIQGYYFSRPLTIEQLHQDYPMVT